LALQSFVDFGLLSSSLPCFTIHSHFTPIPSLHFSQNSPTSSFQLNLGLPILLNKIGLHSAVLFTALYLPILTICTIHLIPCAFMYLTTFACLISKSISSLVFILQFPSRFLLGHKSFSLLSF
jgi:hypothetical protein